MKEPSAMQNKEFNHMDQVFRKAFENVPEESPSAQDWAGMKENLGREGLLKAKGNRHTIFLALLLALAGGFAGIYFFLNDKTQSASKQEPLVPVTVPQEPVISQPEKSLPLTFRQTVQNIPEVENKVSKLKIEHEQPAKQENPTSLVKSVAEKRTEPLTSDAQKERALPDAEHINPENTAQAAIPVMEQEGSAAQMDGVQQQMPVVITQDDRSVVMELPVTETPVTSTPDSAKNVVTDLPSDMPDLNQTSSAQAVTAFIQDTNSQVHKKFLVGIYLSKDFNAYAIKTKTADGEEISSNTDISGQQTFWQYTTGITAAYAKTQRMAVQAGIFFSQKRKITASNTHVGFTEDSALNRIYTNYQYQLSASYLELNVKVKYYLSTGTWRIYAAPGITGGFNFPVRSAQQNYFLREEYNRETIIRDKVILEPFSMGLDLTGGLGLEYNMDKQWALYAEPAYRYGLNPVIKHPAYTRIPVEHYLRAFGIGFGLNYKF